jgi:sterol desaturase/sphingolipid hydroxylase (fatty acid hydroxylase superfamily)
LTDLFGAPGPTQTPSWLVIVSFALVLFVIDDLTRYLVHRAEHRIPWLWEFHKVHHSAEVLTPLTVHRFHPVETLLLGIRGGAVSGAVTGVFFYAFPGTITPWAWFGVNAFNFAYTIFGSNLRHSHIWLSFGPRLEHVFSSPAQHQIHHSCDPAHHDRNFATALSLWDWLGGSLIVTEKARPGAPPPALDFGVGAGKNHRDTIVSAYFDPFRAVFGRPRRFPESVVSSEAGSSETSDVGA